MDLHIVRDTARDYPGLFATLLFGGMAFASALILTFFYILILRSDGLIAPGSGIPFDAYIFLYILFLPVILTVCLAAILGRRLFTDRTLTRFQAAGRGSLIAALSFMLWAAVGELLWIWIDFPSPPGADSSFIGFLSLLGYVLMGLIFVVISILAGMIAAAANTWRKRQDDRTLEQPVQQSDSSLINQRNCERIHTLK
jgi:hypothetical protein